MGWMIHEANLQQNTAVVVYLAITQNSFTIIYIRLVLQEDTRSVSVCPN